MQGVNNEEELREAYAGSQKRATDFLGDGQYI
jgi:hypothetical protein